MLCPSCNYANSDADLCCNLCGLVFPLKVVEERLAVIKAKEQAARITTDRLTPPRGELNLARIDRTPLHGEPILKPTTDRIAKAPTDRIAVAPVKPATDRHERPGTDTIRRPVPPPVTTVAVLVAREKQREFRKNIVRTGSRLWRLTRHATVCFVVLLLACLFREGVFTTTEIVTDVGAKSVVTVLAFCAIMGIPTGLLVSLRRAGRFRGFAIATLLFAFEPPLLSRFVTLADGQQFAAWSLLDLVAAVLAGFIVGLYAEIDR